MSSYSSFTSQSSIIQPEFSDIRDLYNTVRNNASEFGIEGYRVSKKPDLLIIHEHTLGKAKLKDIYEDITKRSKEPSPVTYSPSHQKVNQEYWTPKNGKFEKARRKSYIDEFLKYHGPLPGPSDYLKETPSKSPKKGKKFGFIGKAEDPGFLSNTVALSEEVPSSFNYFSDDQARNKAVIPKQYAVKERKSPVFKYYAPVKREKEREKPDKDIVGPGYLANLEASFMKDGSKHRSPVAVFPKSKAPRVIHQRSSSTKFVPGVGTYKDVDLAYTHDIVKEKIRSAFISKSVFKRYTEVSAMTKSWVPGPGSYQILPEIKKK